MELSRPAKMKQAARNARIANGGEVVSDAEALRSHASASFVEPAPASQEKASSAGTAVFSMVVFSVVFLALFAASYAALRAFSLLALGFSLVAAALSASTAHIAMDWQRVVVFRFGAFNRVVGPGLYFTIPVVEQSAMKVDMRVRVTQFSAAETLSSDLVPLDVSAALFWMVYDAQAACTEVADFAAAVELAAHAALRDAIGRSCATEVAMRRNHLDKELKRVLEEAVAPWGVEVVDVRVRDILLPRELQDVMSREAQAEQKRKARITLMEAERDIFDMIGEISEQHGGDDAALRIRAMHMLYESISDAGGTVVVPSSFSEGFSDILPDDARAIAQI